MPTYSFLPRGIYLFLKAVLFICLDHGTFNQLLKCITDPWSDLPSTHSTEATRRTLRESVRNFYNVKKYFCMVLGTINKKSKHVVTAHIYPKSKANGLQFFYLNLSDIDNPRNCLRLTKEIERAFDTKNLTIIDKNGQLTIIVLNKTLSSKAITLGSRQKFEDIHGSPLMFNNDKRPFHRLLALHCYSAFNNAKIKQREFGLKDEELNNITFYVDNLLEISLNEDKNEYVEKWLYNNPVESNQQLLQSQTITQFVNAFIERYTDNLSKISINNSIQVRTKIYSLYSFRSIERNLRENLTK